MRSIMTMKYALLLNKITHRADQYSVYIEEVNNGTKALAEQLAEIIDELLNDEEQILSFVKANADDIEWD